MHRLGYYSLTPANQPLYALSIRGQVVTKIYDGKPMLLTREFL